MIDLHLLRKTEPKKNFVFALYESNLEELREICSGEGVTVAALLRHLINDFLREWREKPETDKKI